MSTTRDISSNNKIDIVIHFASLKAVGESIDKPLLFILIL